MGLLQHTYLVRILHVKGACDYRTIVGLLQHIYLVRILHVKGARDYRTIVGATAIKKLINLKKN